MAAGPDDGAAMTGCGTAALAVWTELPAGFRRGSCSAWADRNIGGGVLDCFLEGPVFDETGNLLVVDIPFGRVFRISPQDEWTLLAEYDGWPNGMKWRDSRLLIADHKLGLLDMDPHAGGFTVLADHLDGGPLLGLNDLTIAPDGHIYVTDQGTTGLHDPRGRVLRWRAETGLAAVLTNGPSPNGLVMDPLSGWLYVAMTRANAIWRVPFVDGCPSKVGLAIQLTGGVGPDGLALTEDGRLLVVQAPFGVWEHDRHNRAIRFWTAPEDAYVTNLAVRRGRIYVTDSRAGRILVGDLDGAGMS